MEMSTAVLESLYRFTLDHDAIMTPRISYLPPATAAVITADLTGAKIPAKIGGLLSIIGTIIHYDTILYVLYPWREKVHVLCIHIVGRAHSGSALSASETGMRLRPKSVVCRL